MLTKVYHARQRPLDGPLVDDVPLSESDADRTVRRRSQLHRVAGRRRADSITAVQAEQGFDGGKPPTALLYLLLRHALQLSFRETASGLLAAVEPSDLRRCAGSRRSCTSTPTRRSTARAATPSCSAPTIASPASTGLTIGDYIARNVRALESTVLPEHLEALDLLATLPTARLERLFAEHIDTASYRLDAWSTGLLELGARSAARAARCHSIGGSRSRADRRPRSGTAGSHLGAYGWVEDLRPEDKDAHAGELPPDLAADVDKGGHRPARQGPDQPRARPRAVDQPRRHRGRAAQRLRRPRRRDVGRPVVAAGPARSGDPRGDARRPVARRPARLPVRAAPPRQRSADRARPRLSAAPGVPAGRQPDPVDGDDRRRRAGVDRGDERRRRPQAAPCTSTSPATTVSVRQRETAAPAGGRGGRRDRGRRATSATSTTPWPTSSSPRACTRR